MKIIGRANRYGAVVYKTDEDDPRYLGQIGNPGAYVNEVAVREEWLRLPKSWVLL